MIDQLLHGLGKALPLLGPYFGGAVFLLIVQLVVIKRIDEKARRVRLQTQSIYFQMVLLAVLVAMSIFAALK